MKVILEKDPENTRLCTLALDIQEKFNKLFRLYSICHLHFSSRGIVDTPLLGRFLD